MVELSTFIGQLISDIAAARTNADYFAAATSEHYHADPFVKALPIPHYIIEEAEIEVPVMIVGISKNSDEYVKQKAELYEAIKAKLPILLIRTYKFNYVKEREQSSRVLEEKREEEEKIRAEVNKMQSQKRRVDIVKYDFPPLFLEDITVSAREITEKMVANTEKYLDNYNYEILKILDLSDDFSNKLFREIREDVKAYDEDVRPYLSDDAISRAAKYLGNLMFFEFKKILKSKSSVNVDINTVLMNEYATKDCLMHIRLKIKEQDLNLMIEEGQNKKEKRYLSLT